MPYILRVSPHLTPDQLVERFKGCKDAALASRWQAVMLKSEGWSARDIARICKRKEDWVRRTVRAYNDGGPDALEDGRSENGRDPVLEEGLRIALAQALLGPAPDGGFWTSRKVSAWIEARTGTRVSERTGWAYLIKAGFTPQLPRPKHPDADQEAQEAFKKGGFRAVFSSSFENSPGSRSRSGRKTKPGMD
jgi:transposase